MSDKHVGNPNWVKGKSGNPKGRPKRGHTFTDALRESIDKHDLAVMLISKARGGDVIAQKYIYDRLEGKPVETIDNNVTKSPEVIEVIHTVKATDKATDKTDTEDQPTVVER